MNVAKLALEILAILLVVSLPTIICGVVWKIFSARVDNQRLALHCGCLLLFIYAFCLLIPYYFQGYATMPMTYEAAYNPSGLLSFLPIHLFVKFYAHPLFGGWWLVFSAFLIACGRASENKRTDNLIRGVLAGVYLFFFCNILNYARLATVLDT